MNTVQIIPRCDAWIHSPVLPVNQFHPRSRAHRPQTFCRLRHDGNRLFVRFEVEDRFVRSIQVERNGPVSTDSCVEFFVTPRRGEGYLNFEVNAGGTLLLYRMDEPSAVGSRVGVPVPSIWANQVQIAHSLPRVVDPEIVDGVSWDVEIAIPLDLFFAHFPDATIRAPWAANIYKCGDHTSHPHWASWAPIGERLDFHQPAYFRDLAFGD